MREDITGKHSNYVKPNVFRNLVFLLVQVTVARDERRSWAFRSLCETAVTVYKLYVNNLKQMDR